MGVVSISLFDRKKRKKNNGGYALELTLAVSVDNLIYGCVSLEYALHIYIYYIPT